MTYVLTLAYPVSANRYWATRVIKAKATGRWMSMTYVTPEAVAYKEHVAEVAVRAGVPGPIAGPVEIAFRLYPHRPKDWEARQRRDPIGWADTVQCIDLGNVNKVLEDSLNGVVIQDDKWTHRLVGERMPPDHLPARLIVWIRPIERPAHPQAPLL